MATRHDESGAPLSGSVNAFYGAEVSEVSPEPCKALPAPVKRVSRAPRTGTDRDVLPAARRAVIRDHLTRDEESDLRWYFFEADASSLRCPLGTIDIVRGSPREPGYIEDRDLDRGRRYDRIQKRLRRIPNDDTRTLHRYVGGVYDVRYPTLRSAFGVLSPVVTGLLSTIEIEKLEYATLRPDAREAIGVVRVRAERALVRAVRAYREAERGDRL